MTSRASEDGGPLVPTSASGPRSLGRASRCWGLRWGRSRPASQGSCSHAPTPRSRVRASCFPHPALGALRHSIFRPNRLLLGEGLCPCLCAPRGICEVWTTRGCFWTDWNLPSSDLIFQMFSVLGLPLLGSAFLHLGVSFLLNILCPVAGLCSRFFKSCKKTLYFRLGHWGLVYTECSG